MSSEPAAPKAGTKPETNPPATNPPPANPPATEPPAGDKPKTVGKVVEISKRKYDDGTVVRVLSDDKRVWKEVKAP